MKVSGSFFDLVMIIANFIDKTVLLVAIYVFINKYELRRIGADRKKQPKQVVLWKKAVL